MTTAARSSWYAPTAPATKTSSAPRRAPSAPPGSTSRTPGCRRKAGGGDRSAGAAVGYTDERSPVEIIDTALAIPDLTPVARANFYLYRSLHRNLPPDTDVETARAAVHTAASARLAGLPMTYAILAISLREDDPVAALDALRRGGARRAVRRSFIIASTSAWGSVVTLALPTDIAAPHLISRLDRLQAEFANAEVALLTVSLCVLRRADSPAAVPLYAFSSRHPMG